MKLIHSVKIFLFVLASVAGSAVLAHGDEDHSKKPNSGSKTLAKTSSTLEASAAQRLSDGSLFVPKIVQRQLGVRHLVSEIADLPFTIELNGKVIADPNAGGRVQASQAGRIEAGPSGLPSLGQVVRKGQILANLRPVMSSLDRGNSLSILAEIDAQLLTAERKLQRYEQLADALPKATVEAARYDYEALKKRQTAVAASLTKSEALIAPVTGVISIASASNGQVVDAKETLFEIIDPQRLMVEALAYDAILITDIAHANATWSNSSAAGKLHALSLSFVGGGQQMREQAIPLLFRVDTKNLAVAVGQTVKVILQTKREVAGIAVPNAAILKLSGGETVVWIHSAPERFEQRKVKVQTLDAEHIALIDGVEDGERVVTAGASLLAQIR